MWPDIGAMARALSQLQKVDVELAAASGHRDPGITRAFYRHEVCLARGAEPVGRFENLDS